MTRERARTERRDLDKERGEPVAGGAARGGPRALRPTAGPLRDWSTPAADPDHERRRRRVARAARAQAGPRADRRHDGRRARHEPERRRPSEDADAPAPRPGADCSADGSTRLLRRRQPDRRGQHRLPRLLRPRLRPRRVRHQLRREPRRRHHLLGHGQRGDGGGDQRLPGVRDQPGVLRAPRLLPRDRSRRPSSPGTSSSTACRGAS